ncbi:hypothetical protein MRB53_024066 [Persea americana]|uniref:Uncharacterized protein n=1 Tax=Persea americana TaxID=3435 RepID=A0ACC2LBQ6_PERAE|nr:hypothetical protein MRB53_024066 [Persea americana]
MTSLPLSIYCPTLQSPPRSKKEVLPSPSVSIPSAGYSPLSSTRCPYVISSLSRFALRRSPPAQHFPCTQLNLRHYMSCTPISGQIYKRKSILQ